MHHCRLDSRLGLMPPMATSKNMACKLPLVPETGGLRSREVGKKRTTECFSRSFIARGHNQSRGRSIWARLGTYLGTEIRVDLQINA